MQVSKNNKNPIEELLKLDIALNLVNTQGNNHFINSDLKICSKGTKADDNEVILKISFLFTQITINKNIDKISREKWKKIFDNVEAFAKRSSSDGIAKLTESILDPMRSQVFSQEYTFQIERLNSKQIEDYSVRDITDSIKILSTIHDDFQTTNTILLSNILCILEYLMDSEFSKEGGKLVPCGGCFVGKYRISWEQIPIDSPQSAHIALSLQTKMQKDEFNNLLKTLANFLNQKTELNTDSLKVCNIWLTYLASCHFGSAQRNIAERYIKSSINNGFPKLSNELKSFFYCYQSMLKDKSYSSLMSLHPKEAIRFLFKYLDELNDHTQKYVEKKHELDVIYGNLYEKALSALSFLQLSKKEIKQCFSIKLLPPPKEFCSSKLYNVSREKILEFFRTKLLPQLPTIYTSSQAHLFKPFLTELLSLEEGSKDYISLQLKLQNSYLTKVEMNRQHFIYIKQLVIQEIKRLARIKVEEFERILEVDEQTDLEDSPEMQFTLSHMMQLSLLEKKDSNDSLSIFDSIVQSVRSQKILQSDQNAEYRKNLERLSLIIKMMDEYNAAFFVLQLAEFDLTFDNKNEISECINDLYITLDDLIQIEMDFQKMKKSEVPEALEVVSKEKEPDEKVHAKPVQSQVRHKKKKKGRSRRPAYQKSEQECSHESEKEVAKYETTTLSNERIFPIPHHQLFSQKKIFYDSRVSDWFTKHPKWLSTGSYAFLSPQEQKEQKLFHSYPAYITKITIIWGEKSSWLSGKSKTKKPHYSIIGRIHCYKPGKEAMYDGVFTDCFDPKNPSLLFHHYFGPRKFNLSIEDRAKSEIYYPEKELNYSDQRRGEKNETKTQFLDDEQRFTIIQSPGTITIDDTVKQRRYTIIL